MNKTITDIVQQTFWREIEQSQPGKLSSILCDYLKAAVIGTDSQILYVNFGFPEPSFARYVFSAEMCEKNGCAINGSLISLLFSEQTENEKQVAAQELKELLQEVLRLAEKIPVDLGQVCRGIKDENRHDLKTESQFNSVVQKYTNNISDKNDKKNLFKEWADKAVEIWQKYEAQYYLIYWHGTILLDSIVIRQKNGTNQADDLGYDPFELLHKNFLQYVAGFLSVNLMREIATRAALSSVMSRNFSHNIGSHVLTYVTRNINQLNVQDNRLLFEYIQARNDFLAQISTAFPPWSYPAWFGREVMAGFFSQRHLLSYIARSEGFHACVRKGREERHSQELDLALYYKTGGDTKLILGCPEDGACCADNHCDHGTNGSGGTKGDACGGHCSLDHDQRVAIPGGLVGYHAFYTILENIIRNAAKHNTGKIEEDTKLRIEIHFEENPDDPWNYLVRVQESLTKKPESGDDNDIPGKLNRALRQPIIAPSGELEAKNWGMKELRIAATYLSGGDIPDLAREETEGDQAITAGWFPLCDETETLGYRFKMKRPRELLVVGRDYQPDEQQRREFNRHGIDFIEKIYGNSQLDFEMMLLVGHVSVPDDLKRSCPARLISIGNNGLESLQALIGSSPEDNNLEQAANKLKTEVYARWIQCLARRRGIDGDKLNLCVDLAPGGSSGGEEESILKQALSEGMQNAIDDFEQDLGDSVLDYIQEGLSVDQEQFNIVLKKLCKYSGFGDMTYVPPTLPGILGPKADISEDFWKGKELVADLQVNGEGEVQTKIIYKRHDIAGDQSSAPYRENITGASLHAPIVFHLPDDDWGKARTVLQMVENGLLRLAIADERFGLHYAKVAKQFKNNPAQNPLSAAWIKGVKAFFEKKVFDGGGR